MTTNHRILRRSTRTFLGGAIVLSLLAPTAAAGAHPAPLDPVTESVDVGTPAGTVTYCFMGRADWPYELVAPPACWNRHGHL
jgi:hypothetical protein